MAEFEEKLNAILGDPEAMGQIVSIAKALTGESGSSSDSEAAPAQQPPPPAETESSQGQGGQPDWSSVLGLLGGMGGSGNGGNPLSVLGDLDPKMIQAAVTLFSEYSASDDRKTALLTALIPFLKPERQAKVEKAVRIAKLSRVIRAAFRLFKQNGEEAAEDV